VVINKLDIGNLVIKKDLEYFIILRVIVQKEFIKIMNNVVLEKYYIIQEIFNMDIIIKII